MRICYAFASRARPDKFLSALNNIRRMSASDRYFVVAKIDRDDPHVAVYERLIQSYPEVYMKPGLSKSKVHAINRGLKILPVYDIMICMSDDFQFIFYGFDNEIRNDMQENFPDLDGVLHYDDGTKNGRRIMTMSIIGKKYFDRTGTIYNPKYITWYCDDEETEKAKLLGKYKFIDKKLFVHNHHLFGHGAKDAVNEKNDKKHFITADRQTYLQRKQINFGITMLPV